MILLTALIIILFEAITEGLFKKHHLAEFIFKWWMQWIIALVLFGAWFLFAYNFNGYYVTTLKLILGFVFVRFAVFDIAWNLSSGQMWNYYGTTKIYDRVMYYLGGWGWFAKLILGIVGIVFLLGIN
jgi:hypothetical protein